MKIILYIVLTVFIASLALAHDSPPPVENACYTHVAQLPVSCQGGDIIEDQYDSCRVVVCSDNESSLSILACGKPDSAAANTKEYFEMYKLFEVGPTQLEVCLGDACLSNSGYAKSDLFPICPENQEPICGDGIINQEFEECDGFAGVGKHQECTENCALINTTYCGDEVIQEPNDEGMFEECDGSAPDGYECTRHCELNSVACKESICDIEVSCDGEVTEGDCRSCRTVTCENNEGASTILACEKPDQDPHTYFEMYLIDQEGTAPQVCLGDTCLDPKHSGFARSQENAFVCEEPLCGNGILDYNEHCDDGNNESNDGCNSQCVAEDPTLTVIKLIVNDDGGNGTLSDWDLMINNSIVENASVHELLPGSYIVHEILTSPLETGYSATFSGDCDENGSVVLDWNDNKTCIITNNDIGEEKTTLTLYKNVTNDNGGSLGPQNFTLIVCEASDFTQELEIKELVEEPQEPTCYNLSSGDTIEVGAGFYLVGEQETQQLPLYYYEPVNVTGDCVFLENIDGFVIGYVNVSEGQEAICTIINDDREFEFNNIEFSKTVINDDGGNATSFDFFFDLYQLINGTQIPIGGFLGGGGIGQLDAGDYLLVENQVGGNGSYEIVNVTGICTVYNESAISFTIPATGSYACNITNDDIAVTQPLGSITIRKNVDDNAYSGMFFDFVFDNVLNFSISEDGEAFVVGNLNAGTYRVTELVPQDWDLASINCGPADNTAAINGLNVVLSAGEDEDCTFNNLFIGEECEIDHRTQTQGGWGNVANGNNPGVYRDANFASAFPSGVMIGQASNRFSLWTSSAAVEAFLPAGGPSNNLSVNSTNATATTAGVLAGQALTATLNVGFDAADASFSTSDTPLAALVFNDGACLGMTVQEVIDEANAVLAGQPSSLSPSDANDCLTTINENFDDGTTDKGDLVCELLN